MMNHHKAPERRRVLLVEDEAMSRTLLADVLTAAGFDVETCASSAAAMEAFTRFDPDAVVTDIDLGHGTSGLELVVALGKLAPYLAVVILSNYSITADYRQGAVGRASHVRKQDLEDTGMLLRALENALRDRRESQSDATQQEQRLARLTSQQVRVLRMMAEGMSNDEIARRRETTVKSVEHIATRIFAALGLGQDASVNTRVAAARIYIEEAGLPAPTRDVGGTTSPSSPDS
jgi:DNA-binding NarL/FixJ family response regulator